MQSNVIKCPLQTHLQCTVLNWVIRIKIHDYHFCNIFNLNMTCGEFGLPIINENVPENGVRWTCLSWVFNNFSQIWDSTV